MNIANFLRRTATTFPDRQAVHLGDRALFDYRCLADRAARLAGHLRTVQRLVPGDRVALFMSNCPEYLEILYAIWWAGLVAVPINAKLHPRELAFIVDDAAAAALFLSEDLAGAAIDVLPWLTAGYSVHVAGTADYRRLLDSSPCELMDRCPDDLAWLFYTSGTTGKPKGVMQTHRNLMAMSCCYFSDVDDVRTGDGIVYAAPMSHGAGLYNFMHVLKGTRHIIPESGGFDVGELTALARRLGSLSMFAAPTMVKRLVNHVAMSGADPSGFRAIIYGGGPMYVEDIKFALDVMGNRFVQIYGQGESPMTITALSREHLADCCHPRWLARIASVGIAQALVEVCVVDGSGSRLPPGEAGEIVVRGATVMAGYWRNEGATRATIRDGWLHTGDLGVLDDDGFLTLKDRSKDVIISGGSNVYPREVEEVLLKHSAVREVAVIGRADAEWGEAVLAFVVADGVTADELDQLCLDNIARFKRPKEYRFIDSLPKNSYGKVLKTVLRELLK